MRCTLLLALGHFAVAAPVSQANVVVKDSYARKLPAQSVSIESTTQLSQRRWSNASSSVETSSLPLTSSPPSMKGDWRDWWSATSALSSATTDAAAAYRQAQAMASSYSSAKHISKHHSISKYSSMNTATATSISSASSEQSIISRSSSTVASTAMSISSASSQERKISKSSSTDPAIAAFTSSISSQYSLATESSSSAEAKVMSSSSASSPDTSDRDEISTSTSQVLMSHGIWPQPVETKAPSFPIIDSIPIEIQHAPLMGRPDSVGFPQAQPVAPMIPGHIPQAPPMIKPGPFAFPQAQPVIEMIPGHIPQAQPIVEIIPGHVQQQAFPIVGLASDNAQQIPPAPFAPFPPPDTPNHDWSVLDENYQPREKLGIRDLSPDNVNSLDISTREPNSPESGYVEVTSSHHTSPMAVLTDDTGSETGKKSVNRIVEIGIDHVDELADREV